MKEPYNVYSQYLKARYGEKVYKLPVNIPGTCPNRDGTCGTGGCHFCSEVGAGFESHSDTVSVTDQLRKNMAYIGERYGAKKFIAYFQNYSNTYMAYDVFEAYMREACIENIVEVDVATRPDCVDERHLSILNELRREMGVEVVVELGLQTTNDDTLEAINRGHPVDAYVRAVRMIHDHGFKVCTHLILNLPWDDSDEPVRMALLMNDLKMEMVKLHSLYIAKGTVFERLYNIGEIKMNSLQDYVDRVVDFLGHLEPTITVQRLVGRAPETETVFCNWDTSWWKIKDAIIEKMLNNDIYQGKMIGRPRPNR